MSDEQHYLEKGLIAAREASRELAHIDDVKIQAVLESLADRTIAVNTIFLKSQDSNILEG